ncbi:hypothetical protein D3C78_719790 [compost metagenome]
MKIFVIVIFCMTFLSVVINLGRLSNSAYPRIKETKLGEDVTSVLIGMGWLMWSGLLLAA